LERDGHLARERLHDAEPDQRGRVPLVAAPRADAVAFEERTVRLRAGAVRAADPVARRAGDRLRAAERAAVHAPERTRGRLRGVAATEAVGVVVLVLEEDPTTIRQILQADLAGGHPLRVQLRLHRAQDRARLRGFAHAELVAARGQALGLARCIQAE